MAKSLQAKHPLAIRWFHWLNFPIIATMVWSGLLIYWANDAYTITVFGHTFFKFFPDWFYKRANVAYRASEGMAWHFLFMWLFCINGLIYVAFLWLSGQWRELLPKRGSLRHAWHTVLYDLRLRRDHPPGDDYNGAQRIVYTMVVAMGIGSLATGLEMYKPVTFRWIGSIFGGYQMARFFHFWLMILFCAFFLVHVAQVVKAGWANFRSMVTGFAVKSEPAGGEPAQ